MEQIAFCLFAGVTLLSALGVVLFRNVLHSALLLGLSLLGVAGLFATLGADFLFAAQLLIYVGAIAVLILFVVLLAGRASQLAARQVNSQWMAAILICALTFYGMLHYIRPYFATLAKSEPKPTTLALGRMLTNDLAVPFELISLILLAALVGAVIFSRGGRGEGGDS